MFGLSIVCTILFIVSYFTFEIGEDWDTFMGMGASTVALGASLGFALLLIGVGIIHWARKLMADAEMVEQRHPASSSDEDRASAVEVLSTGLEESGIARRPLVRNTMFAAVGVVGVSSLVLFRDLGPLPGDVLGRTVWTKGMRLVRDVVGTPIKVTDIELGDLINATAEALFPTEENGYPDLGQGAEYQAEKAKAAIIVVRIEPEEITPGEGRENWSVDGVLCYSKICTHVGCPISLYERTTHHVLCPCHQSTFDLADSAKVVFGPAARPLPQLPLDVDSEGYLIARSDFTEPIGASFWEREKL
jgi:ubiquinol-cytochrome c reductase iron-sulfur subunit